jgi:RNA polymerase sigma-70 factor (ECF subfamily)
MVRERRTRWIGPGHGIMATGRFVATDGGSPEPGWRPGISVDPGSFDQRTAHGDDRAIVAAVLDGDRDAFRRLVERDGPAVIRACHRVLGDLGEAEDAAQEAFVTAYRSLATWRAEGPFGAWLTRIAVRIAVRQAGRRRTVAWTEPSHAADERPGGSPADRAADQASIAASSRTDPALLSVKAERATEVRAAVRALPEPYREVVALRFFGEASLEEIARETGRPLGTVKTHLHRGLARLRDRLADEGAR